MSGHQNSNNNNNSDSNNNKHNKTTAFLKHHSKKLIALIIAFVIFINWYLGLPAADAISVSIQGPGLTDLSQKTPKPDPLIIDFGDSAAQLKQIDKKVTSGIALSPQIPGQWKWASDRQLVFTPESDWPASKDYDIELDQKLFPAHVLLEKYSFSFKTPLFSASLTNTQIYQDPQNPKLKKMIATVSFSHAVDQSDFKKHITLIKRDADKRLKDKGTEFPFQVSFNKTGNEAYITSDEITIPLQKHELELTIDNDARAKNGGARTDQQLVSKIIVPGMYSYFRVSSASVKLVRNDANDPEQLLIIQTSDSINEEKIISSLDVFLLPNDKPSVNGMKPVKDYRWYRPEEIGPEILQLSDKVSLSAVPAAQQFTKTHSFKINTPANRKLFVRVNKGIESAGGYILSKDFEKVAAIPAYPREVEIMGTGSILSLSGDKRLSVISRGNTALQLEIARILPDQVQHLVSQTSGDFQDPYFNNYTFNEDNISERFSQVRRLKSVAAGKSQFASFDMTKYLNATPLRRNGVFLVKVHSWDAYHQRRTGITAKRLILVTDLGLIVKKNADNTQDVFVMSIKDGEPVSNASVKVISKNGQSQVSSRTDINGHVKIPDLTDYQRENSPVAYFIHAAGDMSFLAFNRHDRDIDLSRFDIGGIHQGNEADKLSAFLFSDRGIYRPGDHFNIGMIIKSSSWSQDLSGIPLEYVITDPRGLIIKNAKISLNEAGFEEIKYSTRENSPTGEYSVNVYIVKDKFSRSLLGSTSLKLEEFLPDRMKISSRFSQERALGWVHPDKLTASVNLKNLYGTAATQRRVTSSMSLSPYSPVFQQYSAFQFYDPLQLKKPYTEQLAETTTNDQGEASIELNLSRFTSTSFSVNINVNGFEAEGGRSVSTQRSILVSPNDYLIGYKPDGELSYVSKDSERSVHFIAIDPALQLTRTDDLSLELIERKYISALVKQDNGSFKYQSVLKEKSITTESLTIPAKGLDLRLPTDKPGDYVYLVKNQAGQELNKVNFSVAGEANLGRSLEKNAELQVRLNKKDYLPGENIKINITAPYTGAGLITIERDKVYHYKWFTTHTTSSIQEITLPAELEGNAYINVSFIRNLNSREIFMSPLSYGIAPFTINRDSRRNKVELFVPYLLRPGEQTKIRYKTSRPGKIVIFAVDEGILQVAGYKTPRPLSHFLQKRALEVNTAQIMDLILPEFSVVQDYAATGGGMSDAESRNLNPFKRRTQKPVAYWSGILDVDQTSTGELDYQVPDYFNGALRFMAVAVSSDSVGATQKTSLARGHFVLSPNTPSFVAPADEFSISLNVANNVEGSGKNARVSISLESAPQLTVIGEKTMQLMIDEGHEKSVRFSLRASEKSLGSSSLRFTATAAGKTSSTAVDISVRPALTSLLKLSGGFVQNSEADIPLSRDMYPDFRDRKIGLSSIPLGLSKGLIGYLDSYPHYCTEQLISKALPIIALKDKPGFGYDSQKSQTAINNIIDILRSRQNSEGAFGFWAANSYSSAKQSLYVLHILLEAQSKDFIIPEKMIKSALQYATAQATISIDNFASARIRASAIYLLTTQGIVTTRYLNDMYEQMNKFYPDRWHHDISRAYMAAAYKLLHLDEKADDLISDMKFGETIQQDYRNFYDSLSHNAQLLFILSRHFPERVNKIDASALQSITTPINDGEFNTLSSAYSILALSAYADRKNNSSISGAQLQTLTKSAGKQPLRIPEDQFPVISLTDDTIKKLILTSADNDQPVFYQLTESGFDRSLPATKIQKGIEVFHEYRDDNGKTISETEMGSEFNVHIKYRSISDDSHYNIAIIDLLPGGFEVVRDATRKNTDTSFDYLDVREDRIILYTSVEKKVQEYIYRIKSTNKGRYTVPPAFAEGMYDRNVIYRGLGSSITVK